jgi:hypothetical protein
LLHSVITVMPLLMMVRGCRVIHCESSYNNESRKGSAVIYMIYLLRMITAMTLTMMTKLQWVKKTRIWLLLEKTVTKTSRQKNRMCMIYLTRIITVNDSVDDDIYTVLGKTDQTVLRMTTMYRIK